MLEAPPAAAVGGDAGGGPPDGNDPERIQKILQMASARQAIDMTEIEETGRTAWAGTVKMKQFKFFWDRMSQHMCLCIL